MCCSPWVTELDATELLNNRKTLPQTWVRIKGGTFAKPILLDEGVEAQSRHLSSNTKPIVLSLLDLVVEDGVGG